MALISSDIAKAKQILSDGGLVSIPTETVYGLAGNGLNANAVADIFSVKNRPTFDPLILHTSSLEKVFDYVENVPSEAIDLANAFWPGPLTLVLKKKDFIPDLVTSGLETLAIRVPNHPLTLGLLRELDFPLAAPSANPFGYVSPTSAAHVNDQLGNKLELILDGGTCGVGIESTIVSFAQEKPKVLRLGGLSVEDIKSVIPEVEVADVSSSKPTAPGMLESHYAPKKSIELKDSIDFQSIDDFSKIGSLVFSKPIDQIPFRNQFILSENEDLNEAAQRLFTGLRMLDKKENIDRIITEFVPNHGLGRAINDRIKRAIA